MTEEAGTVESPFSEASAEYRVEVGSLAHLSIEVGHLTVADLGDGDRLAEHFRLVAPWVATARDACGNPPATGATRTSTCVLVDDRDAPGDPPTAAIARLVSAADAAGVTVDYLARAAACVEVDGVPIAELLVDRLVSDPAPGTAGPVRPPVWKTGWLSNGRRSPEPIAREAMGSFVTWSPPAENGAVDHSVFVDVQLWRDGPSRSWSAALIRAVWQLLRLDLLRYMGENPAAPRGTEVPSDRWDELPAVVALRPDAAPFAAYRAVSILPSRRAAVANAVATILEQVAPDPQLDAALRDSAGADGVALPADVTERLDYLFVAGVAGTG